MDTVQPTLDTLLGDAERLYDDHRWAKAQIVADVNNADVTDLKDYRDRVVLAGKLCWNHKDFASLSVARRVMDAYIKEPLEVVEGVLECKRCKSRKVFSYQVQSRSADEPMTTVAKCSACKLDWTENN